MELSVTCKINKRYGLNGCRWTWCVVCAPSTERSRHVIAYKITNDGLTWFGMGCFAIWQQCALYEICIYKF